MRGTAADASAPSQSGWRNAITRMGEEAPDQLLAHPGNPKIHPKAQQQALEGALSELGWLAPVIVNERTQHVLDGHARIAIAISRGERRVPVAYVDLPPEQEALALATFDPIGNLAVHDTAALDALLKDVTTGDAALQTFLDDLAVRSGLTPPADPLAEWQGMPDFENEAQAARSLSVHFPTHDDCARFCDMLGLQITEKTKTVWFPKAPEKGGYVFAGDAA